MENNLRFSDVLVSARPMLDTARERAFGIGKVVEHFVKTKPAWALGLALGTGVLVGWLVKRR